MFLLNRLIADKRKRKSVDFPAREIIPPLDPRPPDG
jgi:hypothetical protein